MSDDWRGVFSATGYIDAALANLNSPHPICIGIADELIAGFMASLEKPDHVSALKMFMLAWGSLRSATLTTRMGMVSQSPAIQRLAVEAIAYGVLFRFDYLFHDLWKQRHDDPEALKKFRRDGFRRALQVLEERSKFLHTRTNRIYQALIDLGAHPNVLGIDQMSEYHLEAGSDTGRGLYYQLLGQPYVDMSHANTALVYDVLIDGIILVWPDRATQDGFVGSTPRVRQSIISFLRSTRSERSRCK